MRGRRFNTRQSNSRYSNYRPSSCRWGRQTIRSARDRASRIINRRRISRGRKRSKRGRRLLIIRLTVRVTQRAMKATWARTSKPTTTSKMAMQTAITQLVNSPVRMTMTMKTTTVRRTRRRRITISMTGMRKGRMRRRGRTRPSRTGCPRKWKKTAKTTSSMRKTAIEGTKDTIITTTKSLSPRMKTASRVTSNIPMRMIWKTSWTQTTSIKKSRNRVTSSRGEIKRTYGGAKTATECKKGSKMTSRSRGKMVHKI